MQVLMSGMQWTSVSTLTNLRTVESCLSPCADLIGSLSLFKKPFYLFSDKGMRNDVGLHCVKVHCTNYHLWKFQTVDSLSQGENRVQLLEITTFTAWAMATTLKT